MSKTKYKPEFIEEKSKQEVERKSKTQNWHRRFLESIEEAFLDQPLLKEKYEIRNSNRERLYLPNWKGIRRREILSNPDILLITKEDSALAYIFEAEYQINYKKIVGIAILTDIAVRQMKVRHKPNLILVTKEEFPNSEFIQREIQGYVENIEFNLYRSNNFISSFTYLIK